MHYYQHNIKDFNNATRHLTRVERCLYRDAIELYYDTESPLTGDFERLSRKLLCVTTEEKDALMYVLNEFFYLVDGEYRHTRCDFEIEKFHNVKTAKAAAGKASAESKRKKRESKKEQNQTEDQHVLKSVDTEHQHSSTNQEPRTNNQYIYNSNTSIENVIKNYNEIIERINPNWSKCASVTPKRKSMIKSALQLVKPRAEKVDENPDDYLLRLLEAMAKDNNFFSGNPNNKNKDGFRCAFETNFSQTRIVQAIDWVAGN